MRLIEKYTLLNKYGMHVRPAGVLAKLCQTFDCDITVQKDAHAVSGKSVMGLLTLEAPCGTVLTVTADGSDAQEAQEAIAELIDNRFGIADE